MRRFPGLWWWVALGACSAKPADSRAVSPGMPPAPTCNLPGDLEVCQPECEAGNQESCAVLGLMYAQDGAPNNVAHAVALLQTSCAAKVPLGCGGLGSLYVEGIGVPKDVKKAQELFVFACGGGDGLSCESLGGIYAMGMAGPPSITEAVKWYEKACDLGRPAPCAMVAAAIEDGALGPTADRARVPLLLKRACVGDISTACEMLGKAYERGERVVRDLREADRLYAKACSLGSQRGCQAAAR